MEFKLEYFDKNQVCNLFKPFYFDLKTFITSVKFGFFIVSEYM